MPMRQFVDRHIVLHVRELPDFNGCNVAAQNAVKPNIRPLAKGYIANDPHAVGDEHSTGYFRQNPLILNQLPHTFT